MQFIKTLGALSALANVGRAQSDYIQPIPFFLSLNYTATNIADPRLDNPVDFFTPYVSFANSSLFIGQVSLEIYSEPFYATSGGDGISFTSYHSSPTGFTALYLFPNDSRPLATTTPHSGYLPPGASQAGFSWDCKGYLRYAGDNNFFGCPDPVPNSYQVYWLPDGNVAENDNCVGPLALFRTNVTLSPRY